MQDALSLVDNYKYITKTYNGFSTSIIEDFKAANKKRKYITYTDEYIDELFADTKLTGKIIDTFGDAQEGLEVFLAIVEMNQLELESIDRLISITRQDSALMDGLLEIRADITDDLPGYLVRNYLNDKALEKIVKQIGKLTTGKISSGAAMIAGLMIDVGVTIYSKYKPTVKDILYSTLLESYTSAADSTVLVLQKKYIVGTATENEIETYRVAYGFYISSLKLWMKKCESLLKKDNARLKSKLNIYGDSLGTDINYESYLNSCIANAKNAIKDGLITIKNNSVTKYTSNGVVIDESYDSKESISAKFAVIQSKYVPNVGQTWNGSYNRAIQCCGFAQMVFYDLFGYNLSGYYKDRRYMIRAEDRAIKVGQLIGEDVTVNNVKGMFAKAQLGDFVQMDGSTYGQHSAIFVSADDTGVTLYDCNSKPHNETTNCLINQWKITWANWIRWYGTAPSGRQNGISVYHATNYAEIYGDGSDLFYDDSINFVIEDGVLKKYNGWQAHVVIPEEVTEIGDGAFKNNTTMMSVEIPDSLVKIGNEAFYGCTSLTGVYIPDSVESVGSRGFYNCISLVSVKLPENSVYKLVSDSLFNDCSKLNNIVIPDTVTTIGSSAFENCTSLILMDIPDSVTKINNRAYYNCTSIVDLKLSMNLVSLGYSVFYNCDGITNILIPKSLDYCDRELYTVFVTIYNPGPFGGCDNLVDVKFEEGTTEVSSYLFADCNGIEEINLPDTITSIETEAFINCAKLNVVRLPDSITYIGTNAFSSCKSLEVINLPENLEKLGGNAFYDCDSISSIKINKALDDVGFTSNYESGPFNGCDGLKNISFEKGITKIPSNLFLNCSGIQRIDIPDTVDTIGWQSFMNCTNLSEVNISDSVNAIFSKAFYGCVELNNINIPNTVTEIYSSAFANCNSLEKVHIPENLVKLQDGIFSGCVSLNEINLPDTLEIIGGSAFYNCTSLIEVNLPEKVTKINSSAFSHCESLTDLTIAEGVTTIYSNAFEYNKSLAKVTLPDSLQTLGDYAFRYCDVLSEVNLGAGLKTVPKYCFYEDPELQSIILPQQITKVDEFAFGNCTKFTDITMNRNVASAAVNAFSYPAKLTIHGVSGTYAETFANDNSIKFVPLASTTTAIKLNKTKLELGRGYTEILTASVTPSDSVDQFTWTSSDEDIVTIDAYGKVKGIAGGTASVIAMSGDVTQICEVTVYEPVSSIYLNKSSHTGTTGGTLQLSATIYPNSATYKDVTWSSDNDNVATVDENGLVTFGEYGTAKITVTTKDMNRTATCNITVKAIDVTGVSLSEKKATIQTKQQKILKATISPENATNKNVTWTSTNPAVATVSEGVVTGIAKDTAIIMVKTEDGAKTASCTITVEEAADLSAEKTEIVFDAEANDEGTQTAEPVTFTLYNNTDEDIEGVSVVLTSGEAFDVQVPDTITANGSVDVTISPKEDLPVGIYEDIVTIIAGENSVTVPITFEVKAKGSGSNNDSGNTGENGDGGNAGNNGDDIGETGQDIGNGGDGNGGDGEDAGNNGNGGGNGNDGVNSNNDGNGENNNANNSNSSGDDGGNATQNSGSYNGSGNSSLQSTVLSVGTIVENASDKSKYKVLSNTAVAYSTTTNIKAKQIVIPNTVTLNGMKYNVTEIAPNAFKKCKKLTKITIGSNVTKIGKDAFNGCKNLKTVTIKTTKFNKKSIGKNAFKGIYKKATFKCPKKQLKNYKKWIKKAGAPKKAKYKK